MKKTVIATLFATVLIGVPLQAASVDDIVAKNVEARGGLEPLESVASARIVGKLLVQGMSMPYTLEWKRPDKVRFAYTGHGSAENVQAFDGRNGWSLSPLDKEPKKLSEDAIARLLGRADIIQGELVNYRAKGRKVDLLGRETVDGHDAYKLVVTYPGGGKAYVYIDAADHLLFRKERGSTIDGKRVDVVSSIGSHKSVGGLLFAHLIDSALTNETGQSLGRQTFAVESITLNPEIPDRRFEQPR